MRDVAVIGDIHGNARALRAALGCLHTHHFDELVFMGDLLTYGHDVEEVLSLVEVEQTKHGAVLLVGNHDEMYFDLARGDSDYVSRLPHWIRDSVERTLAALDLPRFTSRLRWQREHIVEGVLFAHANPFGARDWTYIESDETRARAEVTLRERGARAGVFGHTHRPRWNGIPISETSYVWRADNVPLIANVGAIGQPRDRSGRSWVARLQLTDEEIACTYQCIHYDLAAHLETVRVAGLQEETLARIASFFEVREDQR